MSQQEPKSVPTYPRKPIDRPEHIDVTEEVLTKEEILLELNECLKQKNDELEELKKKAERLLLDFKRLPGSYNAEKSTLDEDLAMIDALSAKCFNRKIVDFFIDRIRKKANNTLEDDEPSTMVALYHHLCTFDHSASESSD